jgi:hypothetical protein
MSTSTKPQSQEASAPPAVVALVDLLNSRPYAGMADKLDTPESANALLQPFGQHPDEAVSAQRDELVRAVRADLMATIEAAGPGDMARAWAAFSAHIAPITFNQDFSTPGEPLLRQVAGDPVVGRLTRRVAELVAADTWTRLRSCANDICHEVFYDTTRSRTRRWHSYEICGNRSNVAAYRARVKGSGSPGRRS